MQCTSYECTKRRQDPSAGSKKGKGKKGGKEGGAGLAAASVDDAGGSGRGAGGNGDVVAVAMPYVFRYLANELAGMKIKMKLTIGKGGVHG